MNNRYVMLVLGLSAVLLCICLLFAEQVVQPEGIYVDSIRNTDGTLTFMVRTVTYSGQYAPRNAGAIWITNSSNQFVKTIKVWANTYRWTLLKWLASSGNNTTGAVTSASLNSHQLHNITWNGTNVSNASVADGNYTINVEFAEHNATTANPGKFKTVTFTKGSSPVSNTPANESFFRDMQLTWAPSAPAVGTISGIVRNEQNVPIQSAIVTAGTYNTITNSSGSYSLSVPPGNYTVSCTADQFQSSSATDVKVISNQTTQLNFSLVSNVSVSDDVLIPRIQLQTYPNPFIDKTRVRFFLSSKSEVSVSIYDLKGKLIRTLISGSQNPGWQEIDWNGIDDKDKRVSNGHYLFNLKVNDRSYKQLITRL